MVNKIIFDDKIVLYWDRQEEYVKGCLYCVKYALETVYTDKTHFTINKKDNLGESFEVAVSLVESNGETIKLLTEDTVSFAEAKRRIDVTKAPYFAVGDGKINNTRAIQQAINDCGKGDCVYFPVGSFLTGALTLHSDMELYVDSGATLQGTDKAEDYLPKIKSRFEGIERECYRSLLNVGELDHRGGYTTRNIVIRGGGSILGGGRALMIDEIEKESGLPFGDDEETRKKQRGAWVYRGRLLQAGNVENIVIADVTIGMGASWNLHFIYCKNVTTFGCKIVSNEVNNGDGWDPDSSENCTIFDCDFDTRDDMIAIKSGKNPEGNLINKPSKNIKVFDCRCEHGHGLAIGSEMSGGVENVQIWDCQMEKSRCGIEIKGVKARGGYVKVVRVYDSSFSILAIRSVDYNTDGESAKNPPKFEDYYFENISLTGVCLKHTGETWDESAIILEGFDEEEYYLKNVTLKNITVQRRERTPKQNISLFSVQGLNIENVCCK